VTSTRRTIAWTVSAFLVAGTLAGCASDGQSIADGSSPSGPTGTATSTDGTIESESEGAGRFSSEPRFSDPREIHKALIAGGFTDCKVAEDEKLPTSTFHGSLRLDCFYESQDVAMLTYANPIQQASTRQSQEEMGNPLGRRFGDEGWDVFTSLPDVMKQIEKALGN
jgi:hypothetical protein